jgi:hypothetical protein
MLINKGVGIGEVVTLKMVTSEELVGKLVEETDVHYVIERPLTLVMGPKGLGLQPWLFTVDADKPVRIPKDKVVVLGATLKEMSDNYLAGTTGIALA